MQEYDKKWIEELKEKLTTDMIFDIVVDLGGSPRLTVFGFVSSTICHNLPGEGSHKLYYYENTKLFRCYTDCGECFDIFELLKKVKEINYPEAKGTLYGAVKWVAQRYHWNLSYDIVEHDSDLIVDWSYLNLYQKLLSGEMPESVKAIKLKEYDKSILEHLPQPRIIDWEREGITREVINRNDIGYYPTSEQITIPHFDYEGRFIGLRGRALGQLEASLYGKYRPVMIGGILYNHPLGLNLYNLNNSISNIGLIGKAIVFEGEKSCLLYQSYFGKDVDISVACCGSSLSRFQMTLLIEAGAQEIIIAFDRQFQEKNDKEFINLVKNLKRIDSEYRNLVKISFLFDKHYLLPYKASPIDRGADIFLDMFKHRIILT